MELTDKTNTALYTKSTPLTELEMKGLIESGFAFEMFKFMISQGGVGLAANQIGDTRQYFVWTYGVVMNPKIINTGKQIEEGVEGCLSFPGKTVKVSRPRVIDVEYINEDFEIVKETLKGMKARIFQHEFDHLQGVVIVKE